MPRAPGEKSLIGALDARAVARVLAASGDIALMLDEQGTVLEVLGSAGDATTRLAREWRGRPWLSTVTVESRPKIEQMVAEAEAGTDLETARWREVNHPVKGAEDLPLQYTVIRLVAAGRPAARGSAAMIALGRDLRGTVALQRRLVETQQAMERDYWRFREAETRYRHLLETSAEAVLVVEGSSQKVIEANPAARTLLGSGPGGGSRSRLAGLPLASLFDARMADRLQDILAAARASGRREPSAVLLADGSTELLVSASVFRQDDAAYVMVRLAPLVAEPAGGRASRRRAPVSAPEPDWDAAFAGYVQQTPDGLVFCDASGRVLQANRAFLTLAQLSTEEQARGQPLDRWLGRTGVELGVLISNLRQRGSVGRFSTLLRGEFGAELEIEIAGVQLTLGEQPLLAFALRDIERRMRGSGGDGATVVARSPSELAELVGRTPLKEIVAETTDLIEQLCIETALAMSNDNRASAAQLLGLSRQSLYVKLRRYGLGNLGPDDSA